MIETEKGSESIATTAAPGNVSTGDRKSVSTVTPIIDADRERKNALTAEWLKVCGEMEKIDQDFRIRMREALRPYQERLNQIDHELLEYTRPSCFGTFGTCINDGDGSIAEDCPHAAQCARVEIIRMDGDQ